MSHLATKGLPLLAIAILALFTIAPIVSADNPALTAQSFECQKHPECGTDRYWETQAVFKSQFGPTPENINQVFYPPGFTALKCGMDHREIDPVSYREAAAAGRVTYNC